MTDLGDGWIDRIAVEDLAKVLGEADPGPGPTRLFPDWLVERMQLQLMGSGDHGPDGVLYRDDIHSVPVGWPWHHDRRNPDPIVVKPLRASFAASSRWWFGPRTWAERAEDDLRRRRWRYRIRMVPYRLRRAVDIARMRLAHAIWPHGWED